jgi:very-short-patch-repair endonuclease
MTITPEAQILHKALKYKGVPSELEKWDGYKHIDIAIPEAKINIEIDGAQHNLDAEQALSDLKRTYHSFMKGFFTLRIPNSLIREHLDEITDIIVEILNENNEQLEEYEEDEDLI